MIRTVCVLLILSLLCACASIYVDPNPADTTGPEIEIYLRAEKTTERTKYDVDEPILLPSGPRYDYWVVAQDRQSGIQSGDSKYINRNNCSLSCARFRSNNTFSLERPLARHIISSGHIDLENGSSVELLQNVTNWNGILTTETIRFVGIGPFSPPVQPLKELALMGDKVRITFLDSKARTATSGEFMDLPPQPSISEKVIISKDIPSLDRKDYDRMSFDLSVNFVQPNMKTFITPTTTTSGNVRFDTRRNATQPYPTQNFSISNINATQLGSNILAPSFAPRILGDNTGSETVGVTKCIRRVFPANAGINVQVEGAYKVEFKLEFFRERTRLGTKWTRWKPHVENITFLGFVYEKKPCSEATFNIDPLPN